ncbi:MAG: GNAT family N-acetyltransferase [Syntrophaceae bacterium]|nr:GNAT family N-acetyltransferase [Syntrophaceae bacterium]
MNILGKKVLLRAIEEIDLQTLHAWANDPEIWYMLGGWHFPSSMEYMRKWFSALQADQLNQRFAIEAPDLGLIGTANLVEIDWKNNHAFHGMMLGNKDMRGKGYGIDTIMAVMRYAFEELHMERLDSAIIEYNETSLKVYCRRCGWKEEGRMRNWYFRKNRYWDKIIVGITKGDYFALVNTNKYWDEE